jgi:hypothetical protein
MLKNKLLSAMGGVEPSDPDFENVTLLLHGDGTNGGQNNTFLDSSTNNFTITRNGNTTQGSFSPYGPNWSNYFSSPSGINNMLYLPVSGGLNLSGNFTIEFWMLKHNTTGKAILGSNFGGSVNNQIQFDESNVAGRTGLYHPSTGWLTVTCSSSPNNVWTHIAFVRNGTTVTVYLNGVSQGTFSTSVTYNFVNGAIGGLRGYNESFSGGMYGYLSNFRITNTVVYSGNFTPATANLTAISGTQLLTCQSNRYIDNSGNALVLTPQGTISVQRFSPFAPPAAYSTATIGGSGYFDGSGDYLTIGSGSLTLNARTEVFTFETWFYWTGGTSAVLLGSATTTGFYIFIDGTYFVGDGGNNPITSAGSFSKNVWVYVALSFDGTTYRLYSNGALVGSTTTLLANNTVTPSLGAYNNGAAPLFTGYMAGSRLVKGSALYTGSAMTVPIAPPTAIANTSFLCNFTNAAIFDNAMMNNLETVGNAQISTSVVKYGTGSISTPTSGYLINTDAKTSLGSANFTVEFWVNSASDEGGYPGLVAIDSGLTGDFAGLVVTKSGVFVSYNGSSWAIFAASMGTVSDGAWRHIAVVRNGSSLLCFNNGVLQSTTSITSAIFYKGPATIVGKKADNFTAGEAYIDDLRITNGVARYTADFTPPTAALPNK